MANAEQEIYQALTGAGLSQVQAAGVMGNIQNESDFNIESAAMDSNGAMAYGLISWNAASYPNASSLVTGNVSKDLANQVNFLLHNTSGTGQGLQGSTAAQVAGNWANFVEVCQGCTPGGAQNVQRQNNANAILAQAQSGNWGPGGPGISGSGGSNAQTTSIFSGASLPFPFDVPGIIGSLFGGQTGSLTTGIGEGVATGLSGAFTSVTNTMLQKLGFTGWKDFFIRMGLIGLGVIILIIGLTHLTEKNTTISLSSPTASGGGESESAEETSGQSREKSGNSERPRQKSTHSPENQPKTNGGRAGGSKVKTGVSSATHKFGAEAGELAEAAVVA